MACGKAHSPTREVCAKNMAPAWIVRSIKRVAKAVSVLLRYFEGRTFLEQVRYMLACRGAELAAGWKGLTSPVG